MLLIKFEKKNPINEDSLELCECWLFTITIFMT